MRRNNVIMQPSAMPFTTQQPEYVQDLSQIFAEQNARNQQANAVNNKIDQQQRRGSDLTQLDELIAIQDRYKARKNAEMQTPMYKEDQAKELAQALLGTKQVESMSYGGNPIKQSPDGKYWLENGQEVTDVANIQTNNKYDPITGSLEALKSGNPLALQALQEQMKPKAGMDLADRMLLAQQQANYKKDIADAKPKKDTDLKPKQIGDMLTNLLGKNPTDEDRSILTTQLQNADSPEARDAILSAAQQSIIEPSWGNSFRGALAGAGVGGAATLGNPLGFLGGGLIGATLPLMSKRHLNQDKFTQAMKE